MNFIDDQVLATGFNEFIGEVCQSMLGEVKIFGGYIEGFLRIEVGFDVLEHEGGFAYSARADEADESVFPIDLLVDIPLEVGLHLSQQLIGCLK